MILVIFTEFYKHFYNYRRYLSNHHPRIFQRLFAMTGEKCHSSKILEEQLMICIFQLMYQPLSMILSQIVTEQGRFHMTNSY